MKNIYSLAILFLLLAFIMPACQQNSSNDTTATLPPDKTTAPEVAKLSMIKEGFIYESSTFPECHASSIVELSDGKMMATWFGGTKEKNPDVTIWLSTYENGKWSAVTQIVDGIQNESLRYPCWNPVLYKHSSGKLYLFYKVGPSPREWWGEMIYSMDEGLSWSTAEKLPDGILGPIRAKPVELANGTLLCPSSWEFSGDNWKAHMETYDPQSNKWEKTLIDQESEFDVIQPTVLRHSDTKLQILCRSKQNKIVEAWSNDNGKTWGKLAATSLPNPSAGIDGVTLPDGQQVLIYNPTEDGPNDRAKLNLAISKDGINWTDIYKFEDQATGEFSYPAMVQTSDGLLHITYTWKRQKVKHVILKLI